jgi:hypothetical protein
MSRSPIVSVDLTIFFVVVGLRFGIPLLIPRFPLPAVVACLVIDAADQTIFQQYTDLDLTGYQGYDKALDVYYLAIAYLSTIRNWTDPIAYGAARFLWYYRLLGVALFELLDVRALLIIFANTFEYFFIAYEAIRCWWDPTRLRRRQIYLMAAAIWIFVKLPQEWWIHIAQLDFTDFMKQDVLGVDPTTSWGTALSSNWWFVALMAVVIVGITLGVRRLWPRLPAHDWPFTFDLERRFQRPTTLPATSRVTFSGPLVIEKVALVTLITIIFAQLIPNNEATPLQITIAIGFVVVASAGVSQWLAARGIAWSSTAREFAAMGSVNLLLAIVYLALLRQADTEINEAATVFFVVLLTLIITLFDRFHQERLIRRPSEDLVLKIPVSE